MTTREDGFIIHVEPIQTFDNLSEFIDELNDGSLVRCKFNFTVPNDSIFFILKLPRNVKCDDFVDFDFVKNHYNIRIELWYNVNKPDRSNIIIQKGENVPDFTLLKNDHDDHKYQFGNDFIQIACINYSNDEDTCRDCETMYNYLLSVVEKVSDIPQSQHRTSSFVFDNKVIGVEETDSEYIIQLSGLPSICDYT